MGLNMTDNATDSDIARTGLMPESKGKTTARFNFCNTPAEKPASPPTDDLKPLNPPPKKPANPHDFVPKEGGTDPDIASQDRASHKAAFDRW